MKLFHFCHSYQNGRTQQREPLRHVRVVIKCLGTNTTRSFRPSDCIPSHIDSEDDFSAVEFARRGRYEDEKRAHGETRKQLEVSREQNVEIHGKNLDLQALNQSQSRKIDRLVLAQDKDHKQIQALKNENLTLKEHLKNEKLLHKATQAKLSKLNKKQRFVNSSTLTF